QVKENRTRMAAVSGRDVCPVWIRVVEERWQRFVGVGRVNRGQAKLMQIVLALEAVRGFAHFLHGRQQQAEKNANNGDHDQQLDQRESATLFGRGNELKHDVLLNVV